MKHGVFDFRPAIKRLEITSNEVVRSPVVGSYSSVFRGHGVEFDGYREYSPDDDAGLIDWKASMRSDHTLIKQYVEERNQTIHVLLDVSESMLHGSSKGKLKIIYAVELVASLGAAVLAANDNFGWALFSKSVKLFHTAGSGTAQFYKFIQDGADSKHYGGTSDLPSALLAVSKRIPPHTIVIIISDFLSLNGNWEHSLKLFGMKYDTIMIAVHDPYDHALPDDDAFITLEHPTSGDQIMIYSPEAGPEYESAAKAYDQSIRAKFHTARVDYLHISTTENMIEPLVSFFDARSKR